MNASAVLLPAKSPIAVLGVPIDQVTITEAVNLLERMVLSGKPHYFATANVDFLCQATTDPELHRILIEADLVLCDGAPIRWASRLLRSPLPERVAGADLVPALLRLSAQRGFRIFLLGASPESAADAVLMVKRDYPGVMIVGHYSPPFGDLTDLDNDEIRGRIRAAQPDILFVAFGCPKQEKWIAAHCAQLGVPVAGGVGATIDFISHHRRRAPLWMQRVGLEWAFRMFCEPRRLLPRYWRDIRVFSYELVGQYWFDRPGSRYTNAHTVIDVEHWDDRILARFPEYVEARSLAGGPAEQLMAGARHVIVDLSRTQHLASLGVGFLLRLRKVTQLCGRQLVLISPARPALRLLLHMRLGNLFRILPDRSAAEAFLFAEDVARNSATRRVEISAHE